MGGMPEHAHYPVVIIGSGIAGLSAAVYAARGDHAPLVIEGGEPGGQLTLTTDVENYPGFPEGISGPELIQNMKDQAVRFGAELSHGVVEQLDADERPFTIGLSSGEQITADAVIAASGASARTLGVPGEEELMGYGLSTCATCDGAFFRDEEIMVVGGGDAAMEEAVFLTKFASTVHLVHRREEFRAEQIWIDRVRDRVDAGEIELILNSEVTELHGSPEGGLEAVTLVTHPEGHPTAKLDDPATETDRFEVGAVFYAIGHIPNTDYLSGTGVRTDAEGYLVTEEARGGGQTATGVAGLFGAGDVVDHHYQQAATAGGMGVKAALDVDAYLQEIEGETEPATAPADD